MVHPPQSVRRSRPSFSCKAHQLVGFIWIALTSFAWAAPPPTTNGSPAPGTRVRVTAPSTGYESNANVFHTLYLPTDWTANGTYPIIVEYAGNQRSIGGMELGYYQSGGSGFIWIGAPTIQDNGTPSDLSDDSVTNSWWGGTGGTNDPTGAQRNANYIKAAIIDTIENYGGNHAQVFITGFSRGSIATSYIGNWDDTTSDIWLAYLPHAQYDGFGFTTDSGVLARRARIKGRASFITYGADDGWAHNSMAGANALRTDGFPVEEHGLTGFGHTERCFRDPGVQSTTDPTVTDVRARLRAWLAETIANSPGTSSISGTVTDSANNPVAGVRIQSGDTHWTFTDSNGNYELAGLIDGARTVIPSGNGNSFTPSSINATLNGSDLTGRDFTLLGQAPLAPSLSAPQISQITTDGAEISCLLSQADCDTSWIVWATSDLGESHVLTWANSTGGGSAALGSATDGETLDAILSGLDHGTTYFCRFYAENGAGEAWSAAGQFLTLTPDPVAIGDLVTPADAIATSSIASGYQADELINGNGLSGAGEVLDQSHVTVTNNNPTGYWLGSTSVTQELIFTLTEPTDLGAIYLWQYTRTHASWNLRGLRTFDLSFSTDHGATYGSPLQVELSLGAQGVPDDEVAQAFTFPAQTGVTHVRFSNLTNHGDSGWFALAEVRFGEALSISPKPLGLTYDADTDTLTFTWESSAGKTYNLRASSTLSPDPSTWTVVAGGIVPTPPTNTFDLTHPGVPRMFYRIEEVSP